MLGMLEEVVVIGPCVSRMRQFAVTLTRGVTRMDLSGVSHHNHALRGASVETMTYLSDVRPKGEANSPRFILKKAIRRDWITPQHVCSHERGAAT